MLDKYKKILKILTRRQKLIFLFLLILVFIGLIFELFSVGMFIPIIQKLSNNNTQNGFIFKIIGDSFDLKNFLYWALIIYVLKTIFLIFLVHFQHKYVYGLQHTISSKILDIFINSNLEKIKKHNSSYIINSIISESSTFSIIVINHIIHIITEFVICFGLIVFLFYYNTFAASIISISFVSFGLLFVYITNKISTQLGKERIIVESQRLKILNEIFQFIKEIIINSKQYYFLNSFNKLSKRYKNIIQLNSTIIQMPRIFIDLIIFFSFSILIILTIDNKIALLNILPTLSIFAIASIRIMPSFNRVISNIQSVRFNIKVVDIIHDYFNFQKELFNDTPNKYISFKKTIELRNIFYKYNNSNDYVLENFNLTIHKNTIIAIVGESGSGKSTLVDIISGLISPTSGSIFVDDMEVEFKSILWRSKIGYVTQDYYISDGLIFQNVAFGENLEDINFNLALKSLKEASFPIDNFQPIEHFTLIEHGKNISGGQRQRIAIARALYKNSEILILDEATSALDSETETRLLQDIVKLRSTKTIIIITHNKNIINICDKVYNITNKSIN